MTQAPTVPGSRLRPWLPMVLVVYSFRFYFLRCIAGTVSRRRCFTKSIGLISSLSTLFYFLLFTFYPPERSTLFFLSLSLLYFVLSAFTFYSASQALSDADAALQIDPSSLKSLLRRASCLVLLGRLEQVLILLLMKLRVLRNT